MEQQSQASFERDFWRYPGPDHSGSLLDHCQVRVEMMNSIKIELVLPRLLLQIQCHA